ncbi:hypothetical protein DT87_27825 [Streptomyces sp. NTK 937]|nr:hypothetical protein DT87_27825 [Streptomyces sp. NTK 937]
MNQRARRARWASARSMARSPSAGSPAVKAASRSARQSAASAMRRRQSSFVWPDARAMASPCVLERPHFRSASVA